MAFAIPLTKKQYALLAKLVFLGVWMAETDSAAAKGKENPFREIESHVLSFAKEAGHNELVETDAKTGRLRASKKLQDSAMKIVDDYDDEALWDELIHMLVHRDLDKLYGKAAVKEMDEATFQNFHEELESKYVREFDKNGVDRLIIDNTL